MQSLPRRIRHQVGMTLLEVMVAVALTAVSGVIAFAAIQSASEHSQYLQKHHEALKQLDNAVYWLVADIRRTVPLPYPVSKEKSAAVYSANGDTLILSVRGFEALPYSANAVSQVEYRLQESRLLRKRSTISPNGQSDNEERSLSGEVLLENVQTFEVRFLDSGTAKLKKWPAVDRWFQQWPASGASPDTLPWAIWFSIESEQIGHIERLVEVPRGARG